MAATLSSRDRMHRCLERRPHDRIPRHDGYWPETITRWQGEGLQGDGATVHRLLGSDVAGCCWSWPVPFPGRHEVVREDEETRYVRGSMGKVERLWKAKSGTPEHISFDCDSEAKWHAIYRPALLAAPPSVNATHALEAWRKQRATERFSCLQGIEAFEGMRQLMGDVILLTAMAENPDWIRDMAAVYTDLIIRDFQGALAAGAQPDAVWVFGDVGFKHQTFFSPRMYREIIADGHRRLCDFAHQNGMKFIYHTDGDVRAFLDQFVAAGFDCIQPMEAKAGMDVRELAPKYGQQLSFFGNINMVVAATGDRDSLAEEVRTKLAAGMANRGYAYYSDHSVPPTVSWASYQQLIALLDQYGTYG